MIAWPFEHGRPDAGAGAGAAQLAADPALHEALRACGWAPTLQRVTGPADPAAPEIARTFDVLGALAADVAAARRRGAFPLVLAGGALAAAAAVAAAGCAGVCGVVWLSHGAHLDTPDDTRSGDLDAMALSVVLGSAGAWRGLSERLGGLEPVADGHVALLGARGLAPHQRQRLAATAVRCAPGAFDAAAARAAVAGLPAVLVLHVDLGVLDRRAADGPTLQDVLDALDATFDHGRVAVATLCGMDVRGDRDGAIRAAGLAVAERIARRARHDR